MIIRPGVGIVAPKTDLPKTRNYENFLTAYREYTTNHEATNKVHMWTAISLLGAALERKVWLNREHYKIFPNLYMFIIGAPGLVKKSTSTSIGVDLLRELPSINLMAERVTQASLIATLERAQDEFSVKGEPYKQSAAYAYASELTVFMEEVSGNITDLLTTFYDCQPVDWRKPWIYETKGQGQVKIPGPCLNLLGCSTPAWLKRAVPVSAMEGGFASRILFIFENEMPNIFVAIPKHNPQAAEMKKKLIEDLAVINSLTGPFTMDKEAEDAFTYWYENHMRAIYKKRHNNRFAGYFGRKSTQVEKLSMVASVSDSCDLIITAQHVARALAWIQSLERDMIEGFAASGRNQLADITKDVADFIRENGPVSETVLSHIFFTELDDENMQKVLTQLRKMGQITQLTAVDGVAYRAVEGARSMFGDLIDEAEVAAALEAEVKLELVPELQRV